MAVRIPMLPSEVSVPKYRFRFDSPPWIPDSRRVEALGDLVWNR